MKNFYLQLTSYKAGNEIDIPTWVLLIETIASYQLEPEANLAYDQLELETELACDQCPLSILKKIHYLGIYSLIFSIFCKTLTLFSLYCLSIWPRAVAPSLHLFIAFLFQVTSFFYKLMGLD